MRRDVKRRLQRYAITTVIAAAPAAILCAYVTNLLVPTEPLPKPVTYEYIPVAVINESNDTIGIADSDIYGLSLPNGQMDTAAIDRHLTEMQALGVNTVRVLIPWADIQPVPPGQFPTPEWEESMWNRSQYIIDKAASLGMGVLGVLNTAPDWGDIAEDPTLGVYTPPDPEAYGEWAATVAERFQGKVSAYEIWNEPNYSGYWDGYPDPEHYTAVLQAAYDRIKAIDEEAMVVAGVLGTVQDGPVTMNTVTFVERMYAAGAKGFFDALSIHPYSNEIKFSDGLDPNNMWDTPLEQLIKIRERMLLNGDEDLKIWATEYGLSTTIKDEATQAAWVKDFLDTWKELDYAGPAFLYTLRDRLNTSTEEGSMGIFTYEWGRKLVADVIECATKGIKCGSGEDPGEEPAPDPVTALIQAVTAIVQQLYTVVSQAVTEFANAIVNTITEALRNLFSAVTPAPAVAEVPAETRMAIADAVSTATTEVTGEEQPATDALGNEVTDAAPEAAEPEVTEPEVTEPEVTEPEVTEPEVTEPEMTEPEVTEPEVTEPEVVTAPEEPTVVETEESEPVESEEPEVVDSDEPDINDPDDAGTAEDSKDETSDSRNDSDDKSSTDKDANTDDDTRKSDKPSGNSGANGSTGSGGAGSAGGGSAGGTAGGSSGGAGGGSAGGSSGSGGSGGAGGDSGGGSGGGSDNVIYVEPGTDGAVVPA